MPSRILVPGVLVALAVLAGCHEYQAQVEVAADGSGRRTIFLESNTPLAPELLHVLALDGPGWRREHTSTGDDNGYRYRRDRTIADLDGWSEAGGLVIRGRADDAVRLVSTIQVEKVLRDGNLRFVYRETLQWIGVREELAELMGRNYANVLRQEFPTLPDGLVERARGILVAGMVLRWGDLLEAEGDEDAEDELAEEIIVLIADQLRRAGVGADLVASVAETTREWDPLQGVEEALPGVDACVQSSLVLSVTMPGRVLGGNAETVDGKLAVFRVDLLQTLGGPVVLEVECGR